MQIGSKLLQEFGYKESLLILAGLLLDNLLLSSFVRKQGWRVHEFYSYNILIPCRTESALRAYIHKSSNNNQIIINTYSNLSSCNLKCTAVKKRPIRLSYGSWRPCE